MKKQLFTIILALFAVAGFAQQKEASMSGWNNEGFFQYDYVFPNADWDGYSRHFAFGDRFYYGNVYNIGFGISADFYRFRRTEELVNPDLAERHRIAVRSMQIKAEVFQRIAIKSWGVNWDLGAYGGIALTRKIRDYVNVIPAAEEYFPYNRQVETHYNGCQNINRFQYGVTTRIAKTIDDDMSVALVGCYRLSDIITHNDMLLGDPANQPCRWSIGIEFAF